MNFVPSGKIRVAVLRGGPSSEYEESLRTGAAVLRHLQGTPEKYDPYDLFISKDGEWHLHGAVVEPHVALRQADVAWNALHGSFGEDGQIQKILSSLQMPYTGSRAVGSVLAHRRDLGRQALANHGVLTPRFKLIARDEFDDAELLAIFRDFLHPVRVRPSRSRAVLSHVARSFHELEAAIRVAFGHSDKVLVEEWPRGKEVHAGVIENFRGEKLYGLIPYPQYFSSDQHKEIEAVAKQAHQALGLSDYSSSHCLVTTGGKIYVIETHPFPHLDASPLKEALGAVGISERELVQHLVSLARP